MQSWKDYSKDLSTDASVFFHEAKKTKHPWLDALMMLVCAFSLATFAIIYVFIGLWRAATSLFTLRHSKGSR